ncbi:hypothetical protein [Coprococcus comes]|nr:hypothetical protein [Coprococcus comes]NSG32719.1 hypothetical protein [Coprococcus comes]
MADDGNDERDGLWRSCKYGRYDEWISGSPGYAGYDEWISGIPGYAGYDE